MPQLYWVTADAMALTAATAKSVIEISTSSTVHIGIIDWWVEFDGTTSTNTPVKVEVGRFSAAVTTASSYTSSKYDVADGASTATPKTNTSTEGAGTASDVWIHRVSPTSGFYIQYPLGRELIVANSSFFRIRVTAAQTVNCTAGASWFE
jgi:hypothetical protein